jgi:hypothetical protein
MAFNNAKEAVSGLDHGTLVGVAPEEAVCPGSRTRFQSGLHSVHRALETGLYADSFPWPDGKIPVKRGFAVVVGKCDPKIVSPIVVISKHQSFITDQACASSFRVGNRPIIGRTVLLCRHIRISHLRIGISRVHVAERETPSTVCETQGLPMGRFESSGGTQPILPAVRNWRTPLPRGVTYLYELTAGSISRSERVILIIAGIFHTAGHETSNEFRPLWVEYLHEFMTGSISTGPRSWLFHPEGVGSLHAGGKDSQ